MLVETFSAATPTTENLFRSIILFGRNVASYKFALAKTLIHFGRQGQSHISISDLAEPYSAAICEHLKHSPKQVTSRQSAFLDLCTRFNSEEIHHDELIGSTVRLGFQNVIDAFHRVGASDVPSRFFIDMRRSNLPHILLTDDLMQLASEVGNTSLEETESRWRLVETAWRLGTSSSIIGFDHDSEQLVVQRYRRSVTSARAALNGYQKGLCFYCYRSININPGHPELADVDHLFPHVLERRSMATNLDGVWNLVLACQICNRGATGKFDATPATKYIDRLFSRNEYLILSHHPLRDTLILQTGSSPATRHAFLQTLLNAALEYHPTQWSTKPLGSEVF